MEKPQFVNAVVDHVKEKAPAYALALVVAVGGLAITAEGGGENPGRVTDGDDPQNGFQGAPAATATPFEHEINTPLSDLEIR